jgi:formylglycine-generating enzyme
MRSSSGALLSAGATALLGSCLVEIREPVPVGPAAGGQSVSTGTSNGGEATGGGASRGGASPCPDDMVHASDGANVSFCIDRTEVTRTAYVQFLAAVGGTVPVADQPSQCSGNTELTHKPDGSCPNFSSASELPVNCVDWCDAHAFCQWAGKRLCRKLSGSSMTFADEPIVGEWHFACTGGLKTTYPYGDEPDDTACNIPGTSDRAPVGSFEACEGGFPGIFDMQGNVAEWIDACESDAPDALCKTRGGHTFGTAAYWKCNNNVGAEARNDPNPREVGFRCCRDAD